MRSCSVFGRRKVLFFSPCQLCVSLSVLTDMQYQTKLFQAHCHCYCDVVGCGGGGYGDGGVFAQKFADDDVVFQ